jgi:hypothetical protein
MRNMTVRSAVWTGILLLWAAAVVLAQSPAGGSALAVFIVSKGPAQVAAQQPARDLIREIDDPNTGRRWLLYRGVSHQGGPGRLVEADLGPEGAEQQNAGRPAFAGAARTAESSERPVIRSGDRVILEENTPVVEARLEAVALGPALPGSRLQVRLRIGGIVVSAVAIAPGRVALLPNREPQP